MQDFVYKTLELVEKFSFDHCHNKEFCIFSWEIYFIKAIENFFCVYA